MRKTLTRGLKPTLRNCTGGRGYFAILLRTRLRRTQGYEAQGRPWHIRRNEAKQNSKGGHTPCAPTKAKQGTTQQNLTYVPTKGNETRHGNRARLARPFKGLLALLACVFFYGCAGQRGYDAADFPRASSAAGGVSVAWNGELLEIRQAAPGTKKSTVRMGASPRWTLVFRIVESKPRIPPFVAGKKLTLAVESPLYLLKTNDFHVGDSTNGSLVVWRGTDGRLYACEK